jgi:hypothetical protein
MEKVETGVYEVYQPIEEAPNGNHIHVIGKVQKSFENFVVSEIYYIYPDDRFVNYREDKSGINCFMIESKFLKRKIEGEELLKWLI